MSTTDLFTQMDNELADFEASTKKETKRTFDYFTPKLEQGEERKNYKFRFLPNLKFTDILDKYYVTKHEHYVKHEALGGSYDCQKDVDESCPLCSTFWNLKNSKNIVKNELAELINWQEVNFAYILMLDNPDDPSTNGTIMIYKFGKQVLTKINDEKAEGVVVFNPTTGKNFKLVVTRRGGYVNYESSSFIEITPIAKTVEKQKVFQKMYSDYVEEHKLEDFKSSKWTDEKKDKVTSLINQLTGGFNLEKKEELKGTDKFFDDMDEE